MCPGTGNAETTRRMLFSVVTAACRGQMIESAAAAGLIATGCRVTSLGVVTTPGVAIMTEHLGADGGMVITASHNPIEWNGIKALRHDGVAPPAEEAGDIIARFKNEAVGYAPVEQLFPLNHDDSTHQRPR